MAGWMTATRRSALTALLKVLVVLAPIELEVHAGMVLLKLPAGMVPPEMLMELRGGVSGLSDAEGLCATLPPV